MATAASLQSAADQIPTPGVLIERARAMIPALKSRARQCIADRDVPAETIVEMQAAGFFRVLQPKRWGGYEMHPNVFFDVQKLLAEGCMSTGWIYGVLGCHPYELALFDNRAQQEVWGMPCWSLPPISRLAGSPGSMAAFACRATGAFQAGRSTAAGCCSAR
jgi:3-hydroxy-9,10-secoandrosta-1,3,5(10)-triene-9,17-dione monooxygenase